MKSTKKNPKKMIPLFALLFLAGSAIMVVGIVYGHQLNQNMQTGLLIGLMTGIGLTVMGNSLVKIVSLCAYNEQKREASSSKERAAWGAGMVMIPLMGIACVTLGLQGATVGAVFVGALLVIYMLLLLILSCVYR